MGFNDIWNDICYHITNKNWNVSERDFQTIVESLFEKLGWLQHKGEIITQETIRVGATNSIKPDILIKNNGQTLFVVELKKPNITMTEKNSEQLISYMRLLKLDFGILLGETIQVYYELPNDNKPPVRVCDIPFINDLDEGINFIKLLNKTEYTFEKIQKYIEDMLLDKEKKDKSQKYINLLCSVKGSEIIVDLLKKKLSTEFSEEIIASITNEIEINISKKVKINPPIFGPLKGHLPIIEISHDLNKLNRAKAIELCRENGFNLNGEITFSSKNKSTDLYWANPNIEFLTNDWWLLLNDNKNYNLHIFYIPANSIEDTQIRIRADKPEQIDLQIKYGNDAFEDSRSGIHFVDWFKMTIPY
ncbi:hypothetical protein FACS1894102_0610 [Spirochaetia bacterium]|nr:hypothetical protein FACS1894102_0610 [Spirochaetia bacterium]